MLVVVTGIVRTLKKFFVADFSYRLTKIAVLTKNIINKRKVFVLTLCHNAPPLYAVIAEAVFVQRLILPTVFAFALSLVFLGLVILYVAGQVLFTKEVFTVIGKHVGTREYVLLRFCYVYAVLAVQHLGIGKEIIFPCCHDTPPYSCNCLLLFTVRARTPSVKAGQAEERAQDILLIGVFCMSAVLVLGSEFTLNGGLVEIIQTLGNDNQRCFETIINHRHDSSLLCLRLRLYLDLSVCA
jgi:hypothetical protein